MAVDLSAAPTNSGCMERSRKLAWWATAAGLMAAGGGLVVLFAYALSEVLADPSLSLIDGYWIGRLPWTAIGIDLVVIGSTMAVVFGTLAAWISGGGLRRLVSLLALAVAAFWWFVATLPLAGGAPCPSCPPQGPDPLTYAYSLPDLTLLFLVLPAAIAGAAALSERRPGRAASPGPAVG